MHYQLVVAIASAVNPDEVAAALTESVYSYAESLDALAPGCGEWDEWSLGRSWHGCLALTADAADRRFQGTLDLRPEAQCRNVCGCAKHPLSQTD